MENTPKIDLKTMVSIEDGVNYYFTFGPSKNFLEEKGLQFKQPTYVIPYNSFESEINDQLPYKI